MVGALSAAVVFCCAKFAQAAVHKQVAPVHSVLCVARDTHLADGTFVDALLLTSGRRDDLLISDQLGRERVVALDGRSVVTRHGKMREIN